MKTTGAAIKFQLRKVLTLLGRIPGFERSPRHLWSVVQHGNYLKICNALLIEWEMRMGKTKLFGYPYKIIIDTCNYCNLACRLCPTGLKTLKRPQEIMTFEVYKKILDKIKKYAFEVSLHNWGEPFLNPDIFKIIEYTSANNVGTNLSSNLNRIGEQEIDLIVRSGLEYLVVSLDGTTPDVYKRYRVKGNFYEVIQNLKNLINRKRELSSIKPVIEWQFLVMRHNEHQIQEAKKLAREIGVDVIKFISPALPFENFYDRQLAEEWMPLNPKYWQLNSLKLSEQDSVINNKCFYLYRSITISPEGAVSPCCALYHTKYDFGDLLKNDLNEIWNNMYYQSARALFSKKNIVAQSWTICNECKLFRKFI